MKNIEELYISLEAKYSRENFLRFLIEKENNLRAEIKNKLTIDLKPREFLRKAYEMQAQQELLSEIFRNMPLEDRSMRYRIEEEHRQLDKL